MPNETIKVTISRSEYGRTNSQPGQIVGKTELTPEWATLVLTQMLGMRYNVRVRVEELAENHVGIGYEYLYSLPNLRRTDVPTDGHYWYWYDLSYTYLAYSNDLDVIRDMLTQYALANPTLCSHEVYLYTQRIMAARRRA